MRSFIPIFFVLIPSICIDKINPATNLQVSAAEFDEFVRQNKIVNEKTRIVVEPDMKASYILIGPNGWLLDNAANEMTPVEICDCRKEKLKEGLKKLTLDEKRYCNRYAL